MEEMMHNELLSSIQEQTDNFKSDLDGLVRGLSDSLNGIGLKVEVKYSAEIVTKDAEDEKVRVLTEGKVSTIGG